MVSICWEMQYRASGGYGLLALGWLVHLSCGNRPGSTRIFKKSGAARFIISRVPWAVHLLQLSSGTSWTSRGGAAWALGSIESFRYEFSTGCNVWTSTFILRC